MGLQRQVGISSRLDGYVSFKDTTVGNVAHELHTRDAICTS